jgi:glutamine synthetase
MNLISSIEYIWLDGAKPTQQLRSKTRMLPYSDNLSLHDLPEWNFDGSSTNQATGDKSDCVLKPVSLIHDPLRGQGNYLAMCEVFKADGTAHPTNHRATLRELMARGGVKEDVYVGFEQEYTMFEEGRPLGWPKEGYPAPQGPFYCGVGVNKVYGRKIVEEHAEACNRAALCLYGINAEVMPAQWEFQIGYRGIDNEAADPVTMSDHVWFARYLLLLIAEKHGVEISFANKPMRGDWNGAGMHTNFSTRSMRDATSGKAAIQNAITNLEKRHTDHIEVYGHGLAERLTGAHETCSIHEFKSGVSDRGASIRIPISTNQKGCGYIEDRRPGANADPYQVSTKLMRTICNLV